MSSAEPSVVAFDFDGVLVDSEASKALAYADVFAGYADVAAALMRARLADPSANRVEFFTQALRSVLGKPDDERELVRLLAELSDAMVRRVSACRAVPAASALWQRWAGARRYIVSLTPQADLRRIVDARQLGIDASCVFGCPPWSKEQAFREIVSREKTSPDNLLVIGDSLSDADAARAVGAQFQMFDVRSECAPA